VSTIQQGRYDQLLRRVADLKGSGSKVNDALEELFPVFDVENMPAELLFLSGTKIAFGNGNVGATVAETSKVQLFNPVDSGHLITLTSVWVGTTGPATAIEAALSEVALVTDAGNHPLRDTRISVIQNSVGQVRIESSAIGVPTFILFRIGSQESLLITDPNAVAVLAPGTGITFSPNVVNQQINATFFWRERLAEPSELNF